MKNRLWLALMLGCVLGLAGCENSVDNPPPDAAPYGDVQAPSADIEANEGDVDVQVGPPGETPGVDLDVERGGDVDLNIDGEKIRERIQERREERREERQESTPPE